MRWWIRAGRTTWRSCALFRTGTCATRSRPSQVWPKSRRSAASSSSIRSTSIRMRCKPTTSRLIKWSRPCGRAIRTWAGDWLNSRAAKLEDRTPSLPAGVEIVTTYDRAELIERAVETLKGTLIEEMIIVSLVIMIFLWHIPSALIPISTIPIEIILSFIPMHAMGLTANIMSLGGIAFAIGAMVDAAIVLIEQTHKKLEHWEAEGRPGSYKDVVINAVKEVGGPSFFALLVIAVSFIPVFTLEGQEGRLFKPLAY